jgi:hypothetical protein
LARSPIVVFGAFDRHNLGDLLFPHLAQALLPEEELIVAGLASRDLRPVGGHRVQSLAEVAAAVGERPVRVLQLGGELLTCSAWQAAVMLLPPEQVQPTVAWLRRRPSTRRRWVRDALGRDDRAPYVFARDTLPNVERFVVAGVGGVDLARGTATMRDEVVAKLRRADAVSARDRVTHAALRTAGIEAALIPDPAVAVATFFATRVERHARQRDVAAAQQAFAAGYVALQVSADFGDDATLDELARELRELMAATGLGVVLFRAGAAPWHDDDTVLERLAARLPPARVRRFDSLDVWDVCALIERATLVIGSSLHARLVALAFARARVSLPPPAERAQARKLAANVATWDAPAGLPVRSSALAAAAHAALAVPADTHRRVAREALDRWTAGWAAAAIALH